MAHTYTSIAKQHGVDARTVKLWRQKHKDATGDDLGVIEGDERSRSFTDEEALILSSYRSDRQRKTKTPPIPVEAELVEEAPGLLAITNGFEATSIVNYSSHDYGDMASHVFEEVTMSNVNTAQNLRNLFAELEVSDKQLGAVIGAKRLQNIVGTSDQVVNAGLSQYAKANGLGKQSDG